MLGKIYTRCGQLLGTDYLRGAHPNQRIWKIRLTIFGYPYL